MKKIRYVLPILLLVAVMSVSSAFGDEATAFAKDKTIAGIGPFGDFESGFTVAFDADSGNANANAYSINSVEARDVNGVKVVISGGFSSAVAMDIDPFDITPADIAEAMASHVEKVTIVPTPTGEKISMANDIVSHTTVIGDAYAKTNALSNSFVNWGIITTGQSDAWATTKDIGPMVIDVV